MIRAWAVPVAVAAGLACWGPPAVSYAAAQTETVETDPIRCWWRTSVPAVRVGEQFSVVLTCAVVETDSVTVVPNEAELAPNAVQLPPFDVIGGSQGEDLRTADHRFFQYEYRARVVSPELFGKDVPLPEMKISYKVRTRVDAEAVEGRDLVYVLPPASVRVLSLVPGTAVDIRDASRETFTEIDRRLSRASILRVSGGILMAFAALAALVSVSRLVGGTMRKTTASRALASDAAVLRQIGRELTDLQRARREAEWTPALTSRLTAALRVLAGYVLGKPATPMARGDVSEGNLRVRGRGFRSAEITVPGWVTTAVITDALKRSDISHRHVGLLQSLETVLARLTAAQYAQDAALDETAIDAALTVGASALRQMKIDNLWVVKKVHALRARAGLEGRA
ncbi:MAG TPA: hypothetical protein VM818_21760 [Vicinamibacterales bacterium]|nr:hypothetical protein [Vicinamibacterales bacterium]